MSSKRISQAVLIVLSLLLLVSIAANYVLYKQGRDYYLQLNGVRLDPLGLTAYPDFAKNEIFTKDKPVVVFLGDSRAADWPAPNIENFKFVNRGIGAQTTTQVLERFPYHVPALHPDIILIQVGINDLKSIPLFPERKADIIASCKANITGLVELSLQTGARVILTTIFPLGQIPVERRPFWSDDVTISISEVNAFIATLEGENVEIFNTAPVLSNSEGIVDSSYSKDFLHLNEEGYAVLNQELARILNP